MNSEVGQDQQSEILGIKLLTIRITLFLPLSNELSSLFGTILGKTLEAALGITTWYQTW